MGKKIKITENQLKKLVENKNKKAIQENDGGVETNYMFFSNLEQLHRQTKLLMELDPDKVNETLNNGHDWADDHVTVSKENLSQVFDFMMNETKKSNQYIDYEEMTEGRKKTGTKLCARGKSAAQSKFKVYPSAYSNGYAVQVCQGKIKGLDGKRHCSGAYC